LHEPVKIASAGMIASATLSKDEDQFCLADGKKECAS
jgi:hypothetical protein